MNESPEPRAGAGSGAAERHGAGSGAADRHGARLRALACLERRITTLQAEQLRLLAIIDADPATTSMPGHPDKNWAVEDVACALHLSPAVARSRLAEATEAARLPGVLDRMRSGSLPASHVRALVEATRPLTAVEAATVSERVLELSDASSANTFRARVRRAVLAVAARTAEQRRQANVIERRVCLRRGSGEGVTELWALLPDESAAALMAAIESLASRAAVDDQRSVDQRRADALVQLGLDAIAGTHSTALPSSLRLRPLIQVSVALSTLLGEDEAPAELEGIGPISPALARALSADPSGTWRRLVTDPVGRLIDYGRARYRPPLDLLRHVTARDRTCRFPHCTRAASRSDIDHTIPWSAGGSTSAPNLVALCPRHHHLRHETGWRYRRTANGGIEWTTPTGLQYGREPATYPVDRTGYVGSTGSTDLRKVTEPTTYPADRIAHGGAEADPDPPPF